MKKICKYSFHVVVQFFVLTIASWATASEIDTYINRLNAPEVTNLFHCHFAEPSLFTGNMNLSIPLYEFDDPDFPLSFSITYSAEGFKPRNHSGLVGYNWALEVGGCITREVNGCADECIINHKDVIKKMGMLEFLRKETPSADSVYNFSPSVFNEECDTFIRHYYDTEYHIDYLPDIFNYDFCGHKGAFIIDNEGHPLILKGDYVDVDLSTLHQYILETKSNSISFPAGNLSIITIRTLDGYSYEFGGDASSVGCSAQIFKNTENNLFSTCYPLINTWFLKKITAPSGRTITFHYKSVDPSAVNIHSPLWLYNEEFVKIGADGMTDYNNGYYNIVLNPQPGSYQCVSSITKECVLEYIQVSGPTSVTINFHCNPESNNMYPPQKYNLTHQSNLSMYNYQLDSMSVFSNGRKIKQVQLSYESKKSLDNSSSWRFLKSINILGLGVYSFYYNHSTYPSLNVPNQNNYLLYDIDGYWRENFQAGLLMKVIFPTGGWEKYQYEKHYVSFLRHYVEEWLLPEVATGNLIYEKEEAPGYTNGNRISRILTYNKDGSLVNRKDYTYYSGIYYDRHLVRTNTNIYHLLDNLTAYNLNNHPVGYPKVCEHIYSGDNGLLKKNIYYFSIDEDVLPTLNSINIDTNRINQMTDFTWQKYYYDVSAFLMFSERFMTLGKLTGIESFSAGATPSYTECFYYNNARLNTSFLCPQPFISPFSGDTIVAYFEGNYFRLSRKCYIYPDILNQKTKLAYDNGFLSTTEAYYHDKKQRIKKKTTFDSSDTERFVYYLYPDELQATQNSYDTNVRALYMLTKKNQIAQPIEEYAGFKKQNTEYITSGILTKYYTDLPTSQSDTISWNNYHVYPSQVYSLALPSPITNYQQTYLLAGLSMTDGRYQLSKSYQFDNLLRPISVTPIGGPTTTYTWDGYYPSSVSVGSNITTYTNIPHVGITSITDPKGLTTYYSYDSYGRLVEIYHIIDNVKQVVQAFNYNISNE